MKLRKIIGVCCVLSLGLLSAACGSSDGSNGTSGVSASSLDLSGLGDSQIKESLRNLYTAAQKNDGNKVVVYGPAAGDAMKSVWPVFEKRFPGIQVQGVSIFGPDLDSRMTQEFAANNRVGDLVYTGPPDVSGEATHGWIQPFVPAGADKLDSHFVDPKSLYVVAGQNLYAPMYNTNVIKDPPRSWKDLLKPEYKGKLVIADPTVTNGTSLCLAALLSNGAVDDDWLSTLANQQQVTAGPPSSADVANSVVSGQNGMAVTMGAELYLKAKESGAPVGFASGLKEGNFMLGYAMALYAKAPHPKAAKLLETWLLTPEGQRALTKAPQYGTMPGAPAPKGLPSLASIKALLDPPPAVLQEKFPSWLKLFKQDFGS